MTTITPEITLTMSRQDGALAAVAMIDEGTVRAEMLTAPGLETTNGPGAFDWSDPAVDIADVVYAAFCGQCVRGCRHYNYAVGDWDDAHLQAFGEGFHGVAELCFGREAA